MPTNILTRWVALVTTALALCLASAPARTANGEPEYGFAINEGATTAHSRMELEAIYSKLTKVLEVATKRHVAVDPFVNVRLFNEAVERRQHEFVFAKTVDLAAMLVRDKGYVPLVKIDKPYVSGFIAAKGSNINSLADLVGLVVLFPPEDTFTSKLGMAMLKRRGVPVETRPAYTAGGGGAVPGSIVVRHIQFQEAIMTTLRDVPTMYSVGLVNPTILGQWEKGNVGRVFAKTPPMPNWTIVVSPKVPEPEREAARAALLKLGEDDAKQEAVLKPLKINKFVTATKEEYLDLLSYIGTK